MEKIKSRWRKNYLEGDEASTKDDISNHNNINSNNNNNKNNRHHHHSSKHSTPPTFEPLTENLYLDKRKNEHSRNRKDARYMVCDCILTKEERARGVMGCLDDCLNRMLMIECGLKCTLGEHCLNKRFQKLQYAKVEVFKTRKKGWGLQAASDIPAGSFIMEYVGEVVRSKEFRSRVKSYNKQKIKHHYFMALRSDEIIDATVKGNITRFINHSCEPNCETQKWTVNGDLRIGFFTIRDLRAGEEVTFDYQFQRYGRKAQKCYCEAPSCRGYIGGNEQTLSLNGNSLSHTENKAQKKSFKHRILVDVTIEDKINALAEAAAQGLKTKDQVIALASLSVKAEDLVDRRKLLDVIKATKSEISLRLFVDYHGLEILCLWMRDPQADCDFKATIIDILQKLPIPNKTKVVESNVYRMIERWATEEPKLIVQPPSMTNESSQSETGITTKGDGEKSQDESAKNSTEIAAPNENSNNQASQSSTQSQEAISSGPSLLVQPVDSPNIKALASKLLKKFQALSPGFKIPRLSRLQRMEMEKKMDEEVISDEALVNDKSVPEQRNPFASRNYFKSSTTPATNNLVNNATYKNNTLANKRRFDSLTTNNIDLTPAPKITKEEHRQQFEMHARLKDYYEMIDLLPMWPQLQAGGRIMDPQSALPLLAAAAAQQQRLPTGPMPPTQPGTSVDPSASTLGASSANIAQQQTPPMHSNRLTATPQTPQTSHHNPLLMRHLPPSTAFNSLAQIAAQQQAAAAVAIQQYHRLQLPQPSTPQLQPPSTLTPASMQPIHNSTHHQHNHHQVHHHHHHHSHHHQQQVTAAPHQQHSTALQQQHYSNHLDRHFSNNISGSGGGSSSSTTNTNQLDGYHQHFHEQQNQDIKQESTKNLSTLIVLANNSIEPAHAIDDELAFSICDYVEYYSIPDKMLSVEDVLDDANPYPGSYYTTPSGETFFATVALDRRTQRPRSVILNLHIRSDADKLTGNKLKSHSYARRQSSPHSNHHGDRRGDRDAREKILAKMRENRDETGRDDYRRAEKRIRTLK